MIDNKTIKLIKSLRKATGLGIADCKKVINKYNDLGLAIKYALNLLKKPSFDIKNGNWYVSCIRTKFGLYIFKLYAGIDIYNNRTLWELRNALNRIIIDFPLNYSKILNIKIVNGILIRSCTSLKYGLDVFGLYLHNKINDLVYRKCAITIISSYTCNRRLLSILARKLSQQFLSSIVVDNEIKSLSKAISMCYIFNTKKTVAELLSSFSNYYNCKINIQCVLAIK
ncbi:MAG: hypothetical protein ACKESC_00320 [Candidatus Hodgkinia cicadicola]